MPTSSGELRELLITCIEQVKKGDLDYNDAKAIALLAQQVNLSMQVELNARRDAGLSGTNFGSLSVGEQNVIDVSARKVEST